MKVNGKQGESQQTELLELILTLCFKVADYALILIKRREDMENLGTEFQARCIPLTFYKLIEDTHD